MTKAIRIECRAEKVAMKEMVLKVNLLKTKSDV